MSADVENPSRSATAAILPKKGRMWPFKKRYLGIASICFTILLAAAIFLGIHYYRGRSGRRISGALSAFNSKKDKDSAGELYAAIISGGEGDLTSEKVEDIIESGIYPYLTAEQKTKLGSVFAHYVKDPLFESDANVKESWTKLLKSFDEESEDKPKLLKSLDEESKDKLEKITDLEDSEKLVKTIKLIFDDYSTKISDLEGKEGMKEEKAALDKRLEKIVLDCSKLGVDYNSLYKVKSEHEAGGPNFSRLSFLSRLNLMPFARKKELASAYSDSLSDCGIPPVFPDNEPEGCPDAIKNQLKEALEDNTNNELLSSILTFIDSRTKYLELEKNYLEATNAEDSKIKLVSEKLSFDFGANFEKDVEKQVELVQPKIDVLGDSVASTRLRLIGRNFDFETMIEFFDHIEPKRTAFVDELKNALVELEKACNVYSRAKYCRKYKDNGFSLIDAIDYLFGPTMSLERRKIHKNIRDQIIEFVKILEKTHVANPLRLILNNSALDTLKDLKTDNPEIFIQNIFTMRVLNSIFYHMLDVGLADSVARFKEIFEKLKKYAEFLGIIPDSLIPHALIDQFKSRFKVFSRSDLDESEEAKLKFKITEGLARENSVLEKKRAALFKCQDTTDLFNAAFASLQTAGRILQQNLFLAEYIFFYQPSESCTEPLYGYPASPYDPVVFLPPSSEIDLHFEIQNTLKARLINDKLVALLMSNPISSLLPKTDSEAVAASAFKTAMEAKFLWCIRRSALKAALQMFEKRVDTGKLSVSFDNIFSGLFNYGQIIDAVKSCKVVLPTDIDPSKTIKDTIKDKFATKLSELASELGPEITSIPQKGYEQYLTLLAKEKLAELLKEYEK